MSYSICNVLAETGIENISRWLSSDLEEKDLTNRIANKMIRPTTIPQTLEELIIEQSIAREALRLSFVQHKEFAVSLKGIQQERTISDTFDQTMSGETLVNMNKLDMIVGSGGVLSHAPRREQAYRMLVDAFLPEGITQIAVDSIFMMPQLGVMANIDIKELAEEARIAALEVFEKDCLIRLGTCIAPVGKFQGKNGILKAKLEFNGGEKKEISLDDGQLVLIKAGYQKVDITLTPSKGVDVGAGSGEIIQTKIFGGQVGIVFDCRGRPLKISDQASKRILDLKNWSDALKEYPTLEA